MVAVHDSADRRSAGPAVPGGPAGHGGVGRPRLSPRMRQGSSARDEILDAAAELFSEQGYAATSTRAIAMAVGIKQASLYYHFSSKEQILAELLVGTVVPSLEFATALADRPETPEAKLWALAAFDVRLLCSGRWNLGALYLLPELRTSSLAAFQRQRQQLQSRYGELVAAGIDHGAFEAGTAVIATDLVFALVESVVQVRQNRGALDPDLFAPTVADGCLRLLACSNRKLAAAARHGAALLAELPGDA